MRKESPAKYETFADGPPPSRFTTLLSLVEGHMTEPCGEALLICDERLLKKLNDVFKKGEIKRTEAS